MNKWIIGFVLMLGLAAGVVYAARLSSVTKQIEAADIKSMDVDLSLAVGKFELFQARLPKGIPAEFRGDYDESKYEYTHTFEQHNGSGDFAFESQTVDGRNIVNNVGDENRWEFSFSPDVDCNFDIEIGAAQANLDFGNLTVSDLKLDIGAAEADIDFSSPNRTVLRDLKINAGACDLQMKHLGNSKFEFLNFDGGMGSFELDFSGAFDFEAEASIEVGMGSIEIVIPEDVGVRLEAEENWFNSIEFPKGMFNKVRGRDGIWETDNFKTATGKLTLVLDVGMGSAEIKFR